MTVQDALREGHFLLRESQSETPFLDASVLLSDALGVSKENLYASLTDGLETKVLARYRSFLALRKCGIPVSYIRGTKEFYGMRFQVDPRVFVPRPETELLVDLLLPYLRQRLSDADSILLHDVCTGTGCIAICLQHELPRLKVSASDISEEAGQVFARNCLELLGHNLPFTISDLMASLCGPYDVITANPPYLSENLTNRMKSEGWPEPRLALDGGSDGLDVPFRLIERVPRYLKPYGRFYLEADPHQMPSLEKALEDAGFKDVRREADLRGDERVIFGELDPP